MKFIKLFFIVLIFFFSQKAFAAELYIGSPDQVKENETFNVDILFKNDGDLINSADISLSYPQNLVSFEGYKESNGVIKIWLKKPEDHGGSINFSGIIPGGVDGSYIASSGSIGPIKFTELIFKAKSAGQARFSIGHSQILLNDGNGTPIFYTLSDKTLAINSGGSQEGNNNANKDQTPPLPFDVKFVPSEYFSQTPPLLVFSTTDQDSGIKKYEASDDGGKNWVSIESPFPVSRGLFSKEFIIKATDFAGNQMQASVVVPGFLSTVLAISSIILILLIAWYRLLWYKKRR